MTLHQQYKEEIDTLTAAHLKELEERGIPFDKKKLEQLRANTLAIDWDTAAAKKTRLTQIDAILANLKDGRAFPKWSFTDNLYLRIASKEPALVNVTKDVKDCMAGVTGVDVRQFEYIVGAYLSGDSATTDQYIEGVDIYEWIAKKIKKTREEAKLFLLPVMYGISAESLAKRMKIREETAERLIAGWNDINKPIAHTRMMNFYDAKKHGYVTTAVLGNQIPVDTEQDDRKIENAAWSAIVQGTCADIIKVAFCDLCSRGVKVHAIIRDQVMVEPGREGRVKDSINNVVSGWQFLTNVTKHQSPVTTARTQA